MHAKHVKDTSISSSKEAKQSRVDQYNPYANVDYNDHNSKYVSQQKQFLHNGNKTLDDQVYREVGMDRVLR